MLLQSRDLCRSLSEGFRPDPELTVSEWADANRIMSSVSAAEPGPWRTSRTPYLQEIMDTLSPSHPAERVVFIKPAQIGGSEALLNLIGFLIAHSPGPAMLVQPTVDLAKRFSKQRLASLIDTTPSLRKLVSDPRERDSGNTILTKEFPGGVLVLTGANSAAGLRSMPARFILLDECDAYVPDVEGEGDPVDLAIRRSETFANRKVALISTPTVKGLSRIEAAYGESDQRRFYLPCPICAEFQTLKWSQVRWPEHQPALAFYLCEACNAELNDHDRLAMLIHGEWRADAIGDGVTVGFHLNGLYSPWTTWAKLANDFTRASKSPERLKTFVNTILGESWEAPNSVKIDEDSLLTRREAFGPEIPASGALLTCGVDVQGDRLELEIVAWGRDEESWSAAYHVLYGDPARPEIWLELDGILLAEYPHEEGFNMRIAATCVDSGHHSSSVYRFCRERIRRRVFAVKGAAGERPIWPRKISQGKDQSPLFVIGVDAAKEAIFARLKIEQPGPGYCHFSLERDLGYFEQLTAETCRIRYTKGFAHREWSMKPGTRNEALDVRAYSYAALHALIVSGVRLNQHADRVAAIPMRIVLEDGSRAPAATITAAAARPCYRPVPSKWMNR